MKHLRHTVVLLVGLMLSISVSTALAQDGDTLTYTGHGLTFSYPADWSVDEMEGQVMVASSENALNASELEAGESRASFILPTFLDQVGLEATSPPAEVLETILPFLTEQGQAYEDPTEMEMGTNPVTLMVGKSDTQDFVVLAFPFEAGTVLAQFQTPLGEIMERDELGMIAESVKYGAAEPVDMTNLVPITAENGGSLSRVLDLSSTNYYLDAGASFNPDSSLLAVSNYLNDEEMSVLQVIDILSGETMLLVRAGDFEDISYFGSPTFTPDGTQVATGHNSGAVHFWDVKTGELVKSIPAAPENSGGMVFNADGSLLALVAYDNSISGNQLYVVDLATDTAKEGPVYEGYGSVYLKFSPTGNQLAVGVSNQSAVYLYDATHLEEAEPITTLEGEGITIHDLAFSPDGNTLAVASQDQAVYLIDVALPENVFRMDFSRPDPDDAEGIEYVAFTPDGSVMIVAQRPDVTLVNVETGVTIKSVEERVGGWMSVFGISPDGRFIVTGGYETLGLWGVPGA